MATKIIIEKIKGSKRGDASNGRSIYLEVDGVKVDGQISLDINTPLDDVATATVKIILPEIEYKEV